MLALERLSLERGLKDTNAIEEEYKRRLTLPDIEKEYKGSLTTRYKIIKYTCTQQKRIIKGS